MVNRTPELDAFESRWAARPATTTSYADALAWFEAALAHARALGAPGAKPFASHKEAKFAPASDIRVAAALHAVESIRREQGETGA